MGADSSILWTDLTFNPWWGCAKVSPGCKNCYAETFADGRMRLGLWGADASRRFFSAGHWKGPEHWNRAAAKVGKRARVFCASMADVFEDRDDLVEPRARLFDLIWATPWLDWQLLTKRPENIVRLAGKCTVSWPPHAWIGCTVENQAMADERIPHLLRVPAAVRFLSVEPQLEAIDLTPWLGSACRIRPHGVEHSQASCSNEAHYTRGIAWVIVGGESGRGARPFDLAWARSLREQCAAASVPLFVKQFGANAYDGDGEVGGDPTTGRIDLADSHGGDITEFPADLRIREFPEAQP